MSKLVPLDIETNMTINRLPDTTNRNYRDFRPMSNMNAKEKPPIIELGKSELVYAIWTARPKRKKNKKEVSA